MDDLITPPKELDPQEVRRARLQEMEYVNDKGVWQKISRQEAMKSGWPVIGTHWIDVDKGDAQQHCYRSRLVAKEFRWEEPRLQMRRGPEISGLCWKSQASAKPVWPEGFICEV